MDRHFLFQINMSLSLNENKCDKILKQILLDDDGKFPRAMELPTLYDALQ